MDAVLCWGPSGPQQSCFLVLCSLHTQNLETGLACAVGQGLMVLLAQHCALCVQLFLFLFYFIFQFFTFDTVKIFHAER